MEYNEQEARRAATASRNPKKGKWEAPLRYVRDRFNIPSSFTGSNRHGRRQQDRLYRNCYRDQTTGEVFPGSRSRAKARLRTITDRPIRKGFSNVG